MLKRGEPYREPDAGVIHEMEREKLVRHHARRLRALGAEPDAVEAIVEQLLSPAPTAEESQTSIATASIATEGVGLAEETQVAAPRKKCRTAGSPKGRGEVCRGKLGFRARQERKPTIVFNQQPDSRPPTDVPVNKRLSRPQRSQESGNNSA